MSRTRVAAESHHARRRARRSVSTLRPTEAAVHHLQCTAGNRAATSLLTVQRGDDASASAPLPMPGALVPRYVPPAPVPGRVREAIVAWLDSRKVGISMQVESGTTSMPEVIASVRSEVAGAADVEVFQIEALVRQRLGHVTPPATRGRSTPAGEASELAARLRNALGRKVEVGTDAANLVISVSGAVGRLRAGGLEASAEAGAGGVGGRVRVGAGTVTASPDEFGLRTSIPLGGRSGVFAAKLKRSGGVWSTWSASFSVPLVGRNIASARPAVGAIDRSVRAAEQAIRDIAGHLHGGGMPTDAYVRERIGQITPAISAIGGAVETREGPNVSVRVHAGGGPREVAGQDVQEATVGVSLVIMF